MVALNISINAGIAVRTYPVQSFAFDGVAGPVAGAVDMLISSQEPS
jgi:hypothetical protein